MRKIRPVYGCSHKDGLWRGIYRREKQADPPNDEPKYFVADKPDENGDYAIMDERGELTVYVAKYLASVPIWEVIEYLPPGQ